MQSSIRARVKQLTYDHERQGLEKVFSEMLGNCFAQLIEQNKPQEGRDFLAAFVGAMPEYHSKTVECYVKAMTENGISQAEIAAITGDIPPRRL
ncbi:MAG: hypothetical protein PHG23_00065 [Candidatus Pacebacteria bacterium]|nr:hypothetical protein [Candidatus Paceibacterota bacterium]